MVLSKPEGAGIEGAKSKEREKKTDNEPNPGFNRVESEVTSVALTDSGARLWKVVDTIDPNISTFKG